MNAFLHRSPRNRTGPLVALVAAAGLGLTGCAGGEDPVADPPPAPPAPTAPATGGTTADGTADAGAVAWTDRVCTALLPVVGTLRTPPPVDVTDPAAAQNAYRDYLGEAASRAEAAEQEIASAGPPPVDGGEQLAQDVREQVVDLRADVSEALRQVDAADATNPVAVGQAVAVGGNVLGALGNQVQAVGALTADPELRNAFEQAPACADLRSAGAPA
ncbi:hypothetical protein I4I73_29925 [Pseudonocardia sp. KRD-184]|uniref:Lipoprotein n=2 Tax=Pseudonocardia oceani TaxID=2792013 RepID=A0ABS6UHA6_9PSEU|nr:hypothetical protein [Pseudonocardia oceani]MBW0093673.1 hypothetical protein [Pseudonocardia oceani]MBW0100204.1 hypothetical protein [Pseudonocardia oceani]MBW0112925.1 hypothetical protein [Pseudonocardia oceani]MBW0123513.1 hypothetical protein [Pseudonocardia oceani]MBW0131293.1 hypothetical protein [Pseudonocardia oceani]